MQDAVLMVVWDVVFVVVWFAYWRMKRKDMKNIKEH